MSSNNKDRGSSESSQSDTYEVEDIITDRFHRGRLEYRIRWVGYPPEEDTWEPEESLDCPNILKAYKDKKKRELEKRKPKRSGKAKKRRIADSPDPSNVSMDDVFDSAPKTPPPENDPDDEPDDTSLNITKKSKEKEKEKSATPLKASDKASSSKSIRDQAGSSTGKSSSSKGREKHTSSKSSEKSSHRNRNDSSTSISAEKNISTNSCDTPSHRHKHKHKTGKDKSKTVEQSSLAKDKTPEASASETANDSSKTPSSKSTELSSPAKTVLHEKDNRDKELPVPDVTGVPSAEQSCVRRPESNASTETSNSNMPRVVAAVSSEKEKRKDKATPSSINLHNVRRNHASADTQLIRENTAETVQVNTSSQVSTSAPSSSTPQVTSVPQPIAASAFTNVSDGTETLSSRKTPPPESNLVKISEILKKNPPIIKDEVSELSGDFSSKIITLSLIDEPVTSSSGAAPNTTRERSVRSRSSSSSAANNNHAASSSSADKPGSSRQSIRAEISRNLPIVFEDPTRPQPPQPNTVTATPPFVFGSPQQRPFSSLEQQIPAFSALTPPVNSHKCFGQAPTVFQYAQNIQIHNINCQKATFVLSKIWKIRCPECALKSVINDTTVEYAFSLYTVNSKRFFMVKLYNRFNELYCVPATQFKTSCPTSYANFTALTKEYFESLGDLQMDIQEQTTVVHQSMMNGPLHVYLSGGLITNPLIFERPDVVQTIHEIVKLFYLELTLAIGEFMCKQVDTSVLYPFVMNYYENRHPMFTAVSKFGVETNYELFYTSLIPKPNPQP